MDRRDHLLRLTRSEDWPRTTTSSELTELISRAVVERASDSTDDRPLSTRYPKSPGLVGNEILELKVKASSFELRPQPKPQGPQRPPPTSARE